MITLALTFRATLASVSNQDSCPQQEEIAEYKESQWKTKLLEPYGEPMRFASLQENLIRLKGLDQKCYLNGSQTKYNALVE